MGGEILELEVDKILNRGIDIGKEEGKAEGRIEGLVEGMIAIVINAFQNECTIV